jgi:hypothetical protein
MPDLRFAPCQITQEIPDGVDSLEQGCAPMMVGDHTPQPLPEALLRIQLGRGGGLGLQHEASPSIPPDRGEWFPLSTALLEPL